MTILRPPGAKIEENMNFVAARSLPGAARGCQELPWAARGCQELPGTARSCQELPGAARSCQERPPGAKIQEQLVAANPRSHANFYSISCFWMFNLQPFLDLINSKCCTHEYYILNFSDLEKVDKTFFKNTKYQSEKKKTHFFSKGILVPMSYITYYICIIYVLYMYYMCFC